MERIATAPDHMARTVLIALCDDPKTQRRALAFLDRLELQSGARGHLRTTVSATKRKADDQSLQICVRCQEPFLEAENSASACCFHENEMIPVYECWVGHAECCRGLIDTPENKEHYPERFEWVCCELPGMEPGCRKGWHKAATAKHPKYDDSRSVDEPMTDEESEDSWSDEDDESLYDQDESFTVGGDGNDRE